MNGRRDGRPPADPKPRPGGGRRRGRPERPRGTEPLTRPRHLDLERPASEPLSPPEVREMTEHLAFLRQFKGLLKLSLNASEDLLVNGARPPSDRGQCKHLLSKLDRKLVERTLARESLTDDPALRARFLAGVVRIHPELSMLLWYLEALSRVADRREAASAFAMTTDRIDFGALSAGQLSTLLEVLDRTFSGHDRTAALFGLLGSESFAATFDRHLGAVPPALREVFGPLRAVHQELFGGGPRDPDRPERELLRGVELVLSVPDPVLRAYPLEVRERLAELVVARAELGEAPSVPRALLDSLPHAGAAYASLALRRAEQLLAAGDDAQAKTLLGQIVEAHPDHAPAPPPPEALGWPRFGRLALGPERAGALRGALWLDGSAFVWGRTAEPGGAERLLAEARLQESLTVPGVLPALASGRSAEGAWVALPRYGRALAPGELARLAPKDALDLAYEGVAILRGLAAAGVELPDARLDRFLLARGPESLRVADLSGAMRTEPSAAAIRHATLAARFGREVLSSDGRPRPEIPAAVAAALGRAPPMPVLAAALLSAAAYLRDR